MFAQTFGYHTTRLWKNMERKPYTCDILEYLMIYKYSILCKSTYIMLPAGGRGGQWFMHYTICRDLYVCMNNISVIPCCIKTFSSLTKMETSVKWKVYWYEVTFMGYTCIYLGELVPFLTSCDYKPCCSQCQLGGNYRAVQELTAWSAGQ